MSEKYDITVVLSLSETDNYTNINKYKNKNPKYSNYNLERIKKELDTITYYMNDIIYPEIKLNNKLVSMYDGPKNLIYRNNRGNNHVRQYYTLSNSWPIIKKINPDILVRIRDDATLSKPLIFYDCNVLCQDNPALGSLHAAASGEAADTPQARMPFVCPNCTTATCPGSHSILPQMEPPIALCSRHLNPNKKSIITANRHTWGWDQR